MLGSQNSNGEVQAGFSVSEALEEAQRCMLCHDAPCSSSCPGGTDPAKFIRQIRFLNFKGAARTVMSNNPLGGVCSMVCPVDNTCQGACLREGMDRAVDIDGLQRFAVEYGRTHAVTAYDQADKRDEKVAIVGAGPAGLSAAAMLARDGFGVTLFEARPEAGGMLRYGVPKSRLDQNLFLGDLNEILDLGVELKTGVEINTENGAEKLLEEGYSAVFVAPGLWKARTLDLPGSDLEGVSNAVDFLSQSYSAPEETAKLVQDKNVAIIGGGSVAMDVARVASELGANRIYALALEGMNELPATSEELAEALSDGVMIKPQSQANTILGKDGKVTGLDGVEIEWAEPGRLTPDNARVIEDTAFRMNVQAVIFAIGQTPDKAASLILARAASNGKGVEVAEETQATSIERIYAGGDIVRAAGTVVEAVGDGKRAAMAIAAVLGTENTKGVTV